MGAVIRCGFAVLACVLLGAPSAYAEKVKGPGEFPGANGVPFEALDQQIEALEDELQWQIDYINAELSKLESRFSANEGDIDELQSNVEALELQQFFLEHSLAVLRDQASAPDAECPPGFALRALDPLTCERVDGEVRMQVLKQGGMIAAGQMGHALVSCPDGWSVTGGGFSAHPWIEVFLSGPTVNSWVVSGRNVTPDSSFRFAVNGQLFALVNCVMTEGDSAG